MIFTLMQNHILFFKKQLLFSITSKCSRATIILNLLQQVRQHDRQSTVAVTAWYGTKLGSFGLFHNNVEKYIWKTELLFNG